MIWKADIKTTLTVKQNNIQGVMPPPPPKYIKVLTLLARGPTLRDI